MTLTLGAAAGSNTVTATATGLSGSPVTFTATGLAPATASILSGDGQQGVVGTALASPFVVHAVDGGGLSVSGETVTFTVGSGAGSFGGASSVAVKTDAFGNAQATLTLGPGTGTNTATAVASALPAQVLAFTATGQPAAASQIASTSGDGQTGAVGVALLAPFVVTVKDAGGAGVAGYTVAWTVLSGGGSLGGATTTTSVTNGSGQAQVTLTLGSTGGANKVQATASGLTGSPITFTATGLFPANLVLVSGDAQFGNVGAALAAPFVVQVTDSSSTPVPGASVSFAVTANNGSFGGSTPVTVQTQANGQAQATLTPGTAVGANAATATSGALSGSPVTFHATGQPVAATIVSVSGDLQKGKLGTSLLSPLVVKVLDAGNAPVQNYTVTFQVTQGSGTFGGATSVNVLTLADGSASATLTLGASGTANRATASSNGAALTGSPVTFTATGLGSATLAYVSGDAQTGVAAMALASPLVVLVTDGVGTPVPGETVTFAATSNNGLFSGQPSATFTTDASGKATAAWVLGSALGANQAQASVTGLSGSPVTFNATGEPGAATQLGLVSGDNQAAKAGTTLLSPLVVSVLDASNAPVQGYTLQFQVTSGGGNLSGSATQSAVTNASGQASVSLTLGASAGTNQVSVTAPGLAGSPLTFTATGRAPSQMSYVSGDLQSRNVGTALPSPFVVLVQDSGGNPVANQAVTFTVTLGGGSFGGASPVVVSTDASGQASATLTLGSTAGANQAQATAALTGSPVTFDATGQPSTAASMTVSHDGQSGKAGTALLSPFTVTVLDGSSQPVQGYTVSWSVLTGGGNLAGSATRSTVTDASGQASVTLTLGASGGSNTVKADAGALTGSPYTFAATGLVSANLVSVSGDGQTQNEATTLSPFVVQVTDGSSTPVPGETVTFTVTVNNGTFGGSTPVTVTTDVNGRAQASLTLGGNPGANAATAAVAGLAGSPVTFHATGQPPTATKIVATSGDLQSGKAGAALLAPFVVTVQDSLGNGVAGSRSRSRPRAAAATSAGRRPSRS